jgi:hypothetical protein
MVYIRKYSAEHLLRNRSILQILMSFWSVVKNKINDEF